MTFRVVLPRQAAEAVYPGATPSSATRTSGRRPPGLRGTFRGAVDRSGWTDALQVVRIPGTDD